MEDMGSGMGVCSVPGRAHRVLEGRDRHRGGIGQGSTELRTTNCLPRLLLVTVSETLEEILNLKMAMDINHH